VWEWVWEGSYQFHQRFAIHVAERNDLVPLVLLMIAKVQVPLKDREDELIHP
jgi:hypothetical protein